MIKFDYYKVNRELPDLVWNKDNSGIDLYARKEMVIPPAIKIITSGSKSNRIALLNGPPQVEARMIGINCSYYKENEDNYITEQGRVTASMPENNSIHFIPLNVIVRVHSSHHCFIAPRSSLCNKKGLVLVNSLGIIDQTYQGPDDEIKAAVINLTWHPVVIKEGERICQMFFTEKPLVDMNYCPEHWGTENRGGFGSTGM